MEAFRPSVLRQQAGEVLQNTEYPHKKLVLIHTSVAFGLALFVTALNFFLNQQIAQTGGLSGMGLRSVLSTVQSVLELALHAALPFWEIGMVFAALSWVAGEKIEPLGLLQGFRRFGSVLGLQLLQGLLFIMLAVGISQISTILFMFSPLSEAFMELMEPMLMDPEALPQAGMLMEPEQMSAMTDALMPMFVIFGVLYLAVAIPLLYRLRFAQFSLMEGNSVFSAMVHSFRTTKGHTFHLIRLDLHFWWYYLLQAVGLALCFGDILLKMLGVALPFSEDTAFFLFYILGVLVQWAVLWQCRGHVETTYTLAYKSFWKRPPTPREQNLP